MQSNKGFGLIDVVVAVVVVAVLVGAGYVFVQGMQKNSPDNNKDASTELSHKGNSDHQPVEEWVEYRFDKYGLTFKHPKNWQVEVATVEGHEDKPNILVKDDHGQLVTGIYGYRGNNDDCDVIAYDADPQPEITIDGHRATVMKTCDHLDNWIGAQVKNEQAIIITTGFVGKPTEADARKLLESLRGIVSLPIIN